MDTPTLILLYLLIAAAAWALFYYTIKAAVKWGIYEEKQIPAMEEKEIKLKDLERRWSSGQLSKDDYYKQKEDILNNVKAPPTP